MVRQVMSLVSSLLSLLDLSGCKVDVGVVFSISWLVFLVSSTPFCLVNLAVLQRAR